MGFEDLLGTTSPAAVALITGVAVSALVLALALPVYLSIRRGDRTRVDVGPVREELTRPAGQTSSEAPSRREDVLRTLDVVEGDVARFYIVLLYGVMAAATAAMALMYLKYPDDGNRSFMLLYGGVIYVLGMLGLSAQVVGTRRRLARRAGDDRLLPSLWSRIKVTVESSSGSSFVDDAALDRAQRHLDAGGSLEEACALVDQRYRSMNTVMQMVFRTAMQAALRERRKAPR